MVKTQICLKLNCTKCLYPQTFNVIHDSFSGNK